MHVCVLRWIEGEGHFVDPLACNCRLNFLWGFPEKMGKIYVGLVSLARWVPLTGILDPPLVYKYLTCDVVMLHAYRMTRWAVLIILIVRSALNYSSHSSDSSTSPATKRKGICSFKFKYKGYISWLIELPYWLQDG